MHQRRLTLEPAAGIDYTRFSMILATWTAHPARSRPRDLALMVAVLFLTAGAVLASFESLLLTVLAAIIILIAVAPFWMRTVYTLTDTGVSEQRAMRTKMRNWCDLRRLQVGTGAALVSPFAKPSWLDRHRGLIIMFDGADRDQVVSILQERIHQ